ncbi:MAG: hypothetical protein J0H15_10000 [Xanthomonadales bacterium]|nr:hypothetical protein [Xanthomonadales bacterium]
MSRRRSSPAQAHSEEARRRIALEAARLMSESGLRDYRQAKLKAAARLGIADESILPPNQAIEDALREHQRLFGSGREGTLRALRGTAVEAMEFFAGHEPRLVGAVLEGTADEHSAVCLHLYTDQPEAVLDLLGQHRIPYEELDRRLRLDRRRSGDYPALRFRAGEATLDVTLLPYDRLRQAPLDRVTEKPMRRAALAAVRELLGGG